MLKYLALAMQIVQELLAIDTTYVTTGAGSVSFNTYIGAQHVAVTLGIKNL